MNYFQNKRILITGAAGFIGRAVLETLVTGPSLKPLEVVALDHDESGLFTLERSYVVDDGPQVTCMLGDIRDKGRLALACGEIDIVIHAAALKHVSWCETSPGDAVSTNILGVQNVIETARQCRVDTVLFTSSDKAVNPTNVMGTTKLMGERLFTAANNTQRGGGPAFGTCRFGNVLGSEGLVVSIFREQILSGHRVTVTDPAIVRFFIGRAEAAIAILRAAEMIRGGEVLVPRMSAMRMGDLAQCMIQELRGSKVKEGR